jgi:hypothetical protein
VWSGSGGGCRGEEKEPWRSLGFGRERRGRKKSNA